MPAAIPATTDEGYSNARVRTILGVIWHGRGYPYILNVESTIDQSNAIHAGDPTLPLAVFLHVQKFTTRRLAPCRIPAGR